MELGEEGRGRAGTHPVSIWDFRGDDKPKPGRVESGVPEQGERLRVPECSIGQEESAEPG